MKFWRPSKMKVGIAYRTFFESFEHFYPNLELIKKDGDLNKYDLIIFSGGEDIDPNIYGSSNKHSYGINKVRDNVELNILANALKNTDAKILGVCRGHQLINAYLGGKLVQDIYSNYGTTHISPHTLQIMDDYSLTNYILNDRKVNSLHHQGVVYTGNNLKAVSIHKNVVESTESKRIFSVQWHPEFMGDDKFFEVVNRWVLDRESLAKDIKSNIKESDPDSLEEKMKKLRAEMRREPSISHTTMRWTTDTEFIRAMRADTSSTTRSSTDE